MKSEKNIWDNDNLIKILRERGVVVMPTDTVYGIVGKAESEETVERIYRIRKRAPEKPCIILIGDVSELQKFSINFSSDQEEAVRSCWPGSVSIIFDCKDEKFSYLHRGTHTLAFRLPKERELQNLLMQTGPLVAPSANVEGEPTAKNIEEAKKYFGDLVDLYVDGGTIEGKASKIIKLASDGSVSVIRQ